MSHTLKFLTPPNQSPVSVNVTITNYQTSGEAILGSEVGLQTPVYGIAGCATDQSTGNSYPVNSALNGGSALNLVLLDVPAIASTPAAEQALFQSNITSGGTFKLNLTMFGKVEGRPPLPTDPSKFPQ